MERLCIAEHLLRAAASPFHLRRRRFPIRHGWSHERVEDERVVRVVDELVVRVVVKRVDPVRIRDAPLTGGSPRSEPGAARR